VKTEGLSYKGWIIDHAMYNYQGNFEATDPDGDYTNKYSDSIDDLIEEIDEEAKGE
jgi:hypothetical protein